MPVYFDWTCIGFDAHRDHIPLPSRFRPGYRDCVWMAFGKNSESSTSLFHPACLDVKEDFFSPELQGA